MEKYGKLVDGWSNRYRNVDLESKALRSRGTLKPSVSFISLVLKVGSLEQQHHIAREHVQDVHSQAPPQSH